MSEYKLSHLKELEAESIHIIREVESTFPLDAYRFEVEIQRNDRISR